MAEQICMLSLRPQAFSCEFFCEHAELLRQRLPSQRLASAQAWYGQAQGACSRFASCVRRLGLHSEAHEGRCCAYDVQWSCMSARVLLILRMPTLKLQQQTQLLSAMSNTAEPLAGAQLHVCH